MVEYHPYEYRRRDAYEPVAGVHSPDKLATKLSVLTPGDIAAPRPQAADVNVTVRVTEAVEFPPSRVKTIGKVPADPAGMPQGTMPVIVNGAAVAIPACA